MLVRFHGVRGSTPCHGDEIARYGGNTSCVSVDRRRRGSAAVRPRHRAALLRARRARPPFQGTSLVSHLHWDHVQGLPFFGAAAPRGHPARRVRPVRARRAHGRRGAARRRSARRCSRSGSTRSPATSRSASRRATFTVGGFDVDSAAVPHVGEALGYRVTHGGASVAYISDHQQPTGGAAHRRRRRRAVRGRRPADPRRPVHAGRVRPQEHWGHCTIEYAVWLAGEVGARRLALYHHDPTHDDDMIDRLAAAAAACGKAMGVEVFAAREGSRSSSDRADDRGHGRPPRRHRAGRGVRGGRAWRRSPPARRGSPRPASSARRRRWPPSLPGVELVIGALLVTGIAAPSRRSPPPLLLLVFSVAIARQLVDGRHPPCACFGAWSQRPLGEGHLAAQRRPDRRRPRRRPVAARVESRRGPGHERRDSRKASVRGFVAPGLVATARPAVAGAHLGAQQQQAVAPGADGAQPGDPLRRLVVADPRVVEPGGDVQRRVVGRRRCCRTASSSACRLANGSTRGSPHSSHSVTVSGSVGVAHRGDDVDERHLGDGGAEAGRAAS